uniref:EF-hand domain-containing protein n=2 Tax=Araucaria cunninghamii TaxID=56994 RepID=A0A0D6QRC5_ARACU
MKKFILIFFLVVLQFAGQGGSKVLQKAAAGFDGESNRVSDGVDYRISPRIIVKPTGENVLRASSCEQTYDCLPCTTSILGNLFLMVVYGYLMFRAAMYMSNGSQMLLAVMGPGIIGGLFLPILGAFPDALLVVVSGISGSKETAQAQVLIGMGLLAGSSVMLLTALWGSCLIVGKCDLSDDSLAVNSQDTRRFSLFGSGITMDKSTSKASRIMILSIIPFIIVQITQIIHSSSGKRITVLVACITAISCLLCYCLYQVLEPWIQKRRIAYAKRKHMISVILRNVHSRMKHLGSLLREDDQPNVDAIEKIFKTLDKDKDGYLSRGELRGLLLGLELQDRHTTVDDALDKVMSEFDSTTDNQLDLKEFREGILQWLHVATSTVDQSARYSIKLSIFELRTIEELDFLQKEEEEELIEVDSPHKVYLKAVLLMLGGAILAGIFADPLVDAVDNFSDATNIPSFFISFIVMPLATNSSEGVSALIFASHKSKRTASLTYSEIYGAVTMNNTLCLGVFLALVYIRGLDWDFSAEVLVILIVVLVMGLLTSFRTTFPLWMSFIAFLLYPLTLAIVYVLDYILGWS